MAAEAPLFFFYLLLFFSSSMKASSQPSPQSDHTTIENLHLTTIDGDLFVVNRAILYESDLIKQEIYNGRASSNIKLHNTTSRGLHKLIYYVENFNRSDFAVAEWEEDLRNNYQVLFDLFLASNELGMKSVSDMAGGIIGGMMMGKSVAEICRMFNITSSNCEHATRAEPTEQELFFYTFF
ncbi:hypothetical protein LUZ61_000330 [Rhynchospora tenuis]|uniref:BTB domain-containing protein n=1 Tax=Rhynchospora tenuis TaxID=198213 RepID=A0AAD6EPY7_9POAL|nr:hypothetical protein LUZ61_000330 [Rhynchospora tenuis]